MAPRHHQSSVLVGLLAAGAAALGALSFGTLVWAIQGLEAHASVLVVIARVAVAGILGAGGFWAGSLARSGHKASDRIEHMFIRRE